jgi:hypothetical protein
VMVNFYSGFVNCGSPAEATLEDVVGMWTNRFHDRSSQSSLHQDITWAFVPVRGTISSVIWYHRHSDTWSWQREPLLTLSVIRSRLQFGMLHKGCI